LYIGLFDAAVLEHVVAEAFEPGLGPTHLQSALERKLYP
jgi:hypothetical protein